MKAYFFLGFESDLRSSSKPLEKKAFMKENVEKSGISS
jgi:hypothetical protein